MTLRQQVDTIWALRELFETERISRVELDIACSIGIISSTEVIILDQIVIKKR